MKNPILSIRDLHVEYKVYGGRLKVLNGIDLDIYPGEKVGLVGESGCGKTTTMRTVLRVLPKQGVVTQGTVVFQGKSVLNMRGKELQELRGMGISMIFQDPTASLNPVFTVGEQIIDTIKYSGMMKGEKDKNKKVNEHAIKSLQDCALPDVERIMKSYPFQLSGGMRQRVCISMALATQSFLIADEPTTNLDVTIQDQVLHLIRKLVEEKGTSLILITHSLGVAQEMTDRICVMYAGNVVEVAPTKRLFENPCHPYTQGLLKSVPRLFGKGIMEGIPGRISSYLNPPKGCRFHPRCEKVLSICQEKRPPLVEMEEGHCVACYLYGQDQMQLSKEKEVE